MCSTWEDLYGSRTFQHRGDGNPLSALGVQAQLGIKKVTRLLYGPFPETGSLSQISIVNTNQMLHITQSDRHVIQLEVFAASVDILSSEGTRHAVAVVRVPMRFWLYVFAGRAKPELLVIQYVSGNINRSIWAI